MTEEPDTDMDTLVGRWIEVLARVYPGEFPSRDYLSLLAALDDMSVRNRALLVSRFLNVDKSKVYYDSVDVYSNDPEVPLEEVARIKADLTRNGWEDVD